MSFNFNDLPYSYDALEPYIDARTMEIHHSKHHRAYFDKFVAAVSGTALENKSMEEIFSNVSQHPVPVRNNGGGYYNHDLFWKVMGPKAGGQPSGELAKVMDRIFGTFELFKAQFSDAAANRFGSGWAWLIVTQGKELKVISTANQDNPLMDLAEVKGTPILLLDVWEHAYYLKYQNRRPEYIAAFWNVVNWNKVEELYHKAISNK